MVSAWYLVQNDSAKNCQFIEVEDVLEKTGVKCIKITKEEQVQKLKMERDFPYENILEWSEDSPDYEEYVTTFRTEHLHADEEMRYFLDGSGYFDVRDKDDQWIRIALEPGLLIILPPRVYHRFTPGETKFIKVRRFFSAEPEWKAYNRPAETEPHRENIHVDNHQPSAVSTN